MSNVRGRDYDGDVAHTSGQCLRANRALYQ